MASGPYTFTRRSAERIGRVVRDIERGGRDQPAIRFRNTGGGEGVVPIRLAKPTEDIDKDSAGQVQFCRENDAEGSGEEECAALGFESDGDPVCAQNLIGDVKEGDWVYVTQVDGGEAWHIIGRPDQDEPDACGRVTRDLLPLSFASCTGSGAKATAHLAGTCPGPIALVELEAGGSGYATKARVEPTINVSGNGDGADFTVTLEENAAECGDQTWSIVSVSVSGESPHGYKHGDRLEVAVSSGGVEVQRAALTIVAERSEPAVNVVNAGSTDDLQWCLALLEQNETPINTWRVDSVDVLTNQDGYTDNAPVSFVAASETDTCQIVGYGKVRTIRAEPTLQVTPAMTGGSGAQLAASLDQTTDAENRSVWIVDGISVAQPGSKYKVGGQVLVRCTDGVQVTRATAQISSVTETGGIEAVTVNNPGKYYKDTGEAESITVLNGGAYYREIPVDVDVEDGGQYYAEDQEGEPYVADVTVSLGQLAPSAGSGATFSATIDDDPSSPTFGQITGVTIDNAGDNYVDQGYDYPLAWNGMKFSDLPGYDGSAVQILGHGAGGCLSWFNITSCEEDTSGVCCVDGAVDGDHTTQESCETAGGTWTPGATDEDLPGPCCE